MKYKLVIFDFDGTLADSFSSFLWAMGYAAQRHGFRTIDPKEVDELRGFSSRQLMQFLGIPMWKVPFIAADMRKLMLERISDVQLFAGVDDLLDALRVAGVEVAIVTSNTLANVRAVLRPDLEALVQHFECGASLFGKKSKLRALLRGTGFTTNEVLCVGDESRDADAAHAMNLEFVGVVWGYTTRSALERCSDKPLLQQPMDLLTLVNGDAT